MNKFKNKDSVSFAIIFVTSYISNFEKHGTIFSWQLQSSEHNYLHKFKWYFKNFQMK